MESGTIDVKTIMKYVLHNESIVCYLDGSSVSFTVQFLSLV
jgi:hypothetical protein